MMALYHKIAWLALYNKASSPNSFPVPEKICSPKVSGLTLYDEVPGLICSYKNPNMPYSIKAPRLPYSIEVPRLAFPHKVLMVPWLTCSPKVSRLTLYHKDLWLPFYDKAPRLTCYPNPRFDIIKPKVPPLCVGFEP